MKTDISPAIIVRVKEFGESDLLVTFFTPAKGQLKGVAKGARRSRKRFVNCLDICSLVNLEYTSKRREGTLCLLHSGKLINGYPGLRSDFTALSKASFMIELTEILFPFGVSDPKMFELLKEAFAAMTEGEALNLIPVIFEVKAMALGGYRINLERCSMCGRPYKAEGMAVFNRAEGSISCLKCQPESALLPGMRPETVNALKQMQTEPLSDLKGIKLADEILKEIKTVLKLHREYRLERRVKTSKYVE
ncbi:MAG: DNA repair protein RecO [Desulfobacteraceae bacterium]|jgi:DNA repair protein RecO (recombination protein O)